MEGGRLSGGLISELHSEAVTWDAVAEGGVQWQAFVCMKVSLEDLYLVWLIGANILEETAASIFRVALLHFISFGKYFGQK